MTYFNFLKSWPAGVTLASIPVSSNNQILSPAKQPSLDVPWADTAKGIPLLLANESSLRRISKEESGVFPGIGVLEITEDIGEIKWKMGQQHNYFK